MASGPRVLVPGPRHAISRVAELVPERLHHELGRVEVREALPQVHAAAAQLPSDAAELAEDTLARLIQRRCRALLVHLVLELTLRCRGPGSARGRAPHQRARQQVCEDTPERVGTGRQVPILVHNCAVPLDRAALLQLPLGRLKAALNASLVVVPSGPEPVLQRGQAAQRRDEHEARPAARHAALRQVLPQLPHALQVDVQQADAARGPLGVDGGEGGAVEVAMHLSILQELVVPDPALHLLTLRKVVVDTVHLTATWTSRGMGDNEPYAALQLVI
mmetsp:Transcript_106266/g.310685  ORF Transcript_106266/g.310685 Transcript_106266/m.310685 type:complete len:276 (+) Transcript_106266:1230-2057(+)